LGFEDSSDYTLQESKYVSCPPKVNDGKLLFNVNCQGRKEQLTPEQVTAAFINKINSITNLNKLASKYQIIAVPNYLTHSERKALLNSLQIAKESTNGSYGYQLITESIAIGSDYGFYKMNEFSDKEEEAKTVLFVDFGHSKLSAYAMKFTKNYQKVIYEKHLRQLGCKNIDQLMFHFYADLF
jgi:heat shock 70kDa protein 4